MLEWTMKYTVEEIYRRSQEKGIRWARYTRRHRCSKDKQMKAREFFVDIDRQETGKLTYPGVPYRFPRYKGKRRRQPFARENNEEIYCGRLGYSRRDLARMAGSRYHLMISKELRLYQILKTKAGNRMENCSSERIIRVVALTWVWAGPWMGAVLGGHGGGGHQGGDQTAARCPKSGQVNQGFCRGY